MYIQHADNNNDIARTTLLIGPLLNTVQTVTTIITIKLKDTVRFLLAP